MNENSFFKLFWTFSAKSAKKYKAIPTHPHHSTPPFFYIKFNSKENKRKFFPKNKPKECTLFNQTAVPFSFPLCWEEKSESLRVGRKQRGPCMHAKSLQSCPTLCDPMDCSPPASSVHGILQARILEWAAISSSGGLPTQGSKTCLLCLLLWQAVSLPLEPSGKPRGKINLTELICSLGPLRNHSSLPGLAPGCCVYCNKAAWKYENLTYAL